MIEKKNLTARIVIDDPDPKDLVEHLKGRDLSPDLVSYLKQTVQRHKGGTRKINIPSTHKNVGVVLLGKAKLEETHLHMQDELHVFFAGKVVVVKWLVRGEEGLCVPEDVFSVLEIKKVKVEGEQVDVVLTASGNDFSILVDFALYTAPSTTLDIEHPLNQRPAD